MSTRRPAFPIPSSSSLLTLLTLLSCFSYLMAVAGVRKNDPATIVAMKGSPKSANGCLVKAERYLDAMVLASEAGRNFLRANTAMVGLLIEFSELLKPIIRRWRGESRK
jgi:hypothetical protein